MRMKWIVLVVACVCVGSGFGDRCSVFDAQPLDATLGRVYAGIEGTTCEEKSRKAYTTVEMAAVSAVALRLAETELAHAARNLYGTLDKEGQRLMVESHAAWKEYARLQALFVTDGCRNGSARGLYSAGIRRTETERRTKLYKELLAGKTPCTTGLSMYD